MMRRGLHGLVLAGTLAGTLLAAAGCGLVEPVRDPRGNKVDDDRLAEIQPGVHSRADVATLLGSPALTSMFTDTTWYYVSAVSRNRIVRPAALDDQKVVAIHFDERGIVTKVDNVARDEMREIEPVARVTPTPGTERNFFQQLFGNIGRFGTGARPGGTPGGGPGP